MAASDDKTSATRIRKLFSRFDADGDGSITISELKSGLRKVGSSVSDRDVYKYMRKIDTDGDGRIDFTEFAQFFVESVMAKEDMGKKKKKANLVAVRKKVPSHAELWRRFREADTDGNGSISVEELKVALGCGEDDDDEWFEFMRLADENGDGEISFDEYVVAMVKLHLRD